jgi:hypothetical protein
VPQRNGVDEKSPQKAKAVRRRIRYRYEFGVQWGWGVNNDDGNRIAGIILIIAEPKFASSLITKNLILTIFAKRSYKWRVFNMEIANTHQFVLMNALFCT